MFSLHSSLPLILLLPKTISNTANIAAFAIFDANAPNITAFGIFDVSAAVFATVFHYLEIATVAVVNGFTAVIAAADSTTA